MTTREMILSVLGPDDCAQRGVILGELLAGLLVLGVLGLLLVVLLSAAGVLR